MRLTHIYIPTVRLSRIYILSVRLTHIYIPTVRLSHIYILSVRLIHIYISVETPIIATYVLFLTKFQFELRFLYSATEGISPYN